MTSDETPDNVLVLAREALAAQFECSVTAFPALPARTRRGEMDHTYEIKAIVRAILADRASRALPSTALAARPEEGWQIKPLEWEEWSGGDWVAICDLGLYRCGHEGEHWRVEFARADRRLSRRPVLRLTGLVSAQAAAQADYETRIRSAFAAPSTPPTAGDGHD